MKKTFNQWTKDDLRLEFGLRRILHCPAWEAWVARIASTSISLSELELTMLGTLRERADFYIDDWNEWELRDQFIGMVISLADFNDPERFFSAFSERNLLAVLRSSQNDKKIELSGKADWMVATGMATPGKPYFFVHEYKQEESGTKSNRGQLLATLLAAQELNSDGLPIYGAYVLGRNWFFVVLQGREYCISDAYVATKEGDLLDILRLLKAQKLIIIERTEMD